MMFKSRFEADMAQFLDRLKLNWYYEPLSMLLPNGVHYMPDFYVPQIRLWVECRGYESLKGEAQIKSFARQIVDNTLHEITGKAEHLFSDYLVIRGDSLHFWEPADRWPVFESDLVIAGRCKHCGSWFFCSQQGAYQCRSCGTWDGNNHLADTVWLRIDKHRVCGPHPFNLKELGRKHMYEEYLKRF